MSYVNTGRGIIGQLRQVAVDVHGTRTPTGIVKPNDPSDPDYIAPVDNEETEAACPPSLVTINYDVIEPSSPYADVNLQVKANGTIVLDLFTNASGSFTVNAGQTISVEAYSTMPTTGDAATLHLNVQQDGSNIFDDTEPDMPPPDVHILMSFIATNDSVYDILAQAVATTTTTTTTTTTLLYFNVYTHETFRKDCTDDPDTTGTFVDYPVPAGTYTSTISQADADAQATADITANGQNNANTNGSCIPSDKGSTILIDYDTDTDADLCLYCGTGATSEVDEIVASTANGGPLQRPNDGTDPANCYILSSDKLTTANTRRFAINLAYFVTKYPGIDHFVFIMQGRSSSGMSVGGSYAMRDITEGHLIMVDTGGGVMEPAVSMGSSIPITYSSNIVGGADGTVGVGVGSPVLQLDYVYSTNTLTATTF